MATRVHSRHATKMQDRRKKKKRKKETFETKDCRSVYCKASAWRPCRKTELLVKEAITRFIYLSLPKAQRKLR